MVPSDPMAGEEYIYQPEEERKYIYYYVSDTTDMIYEYIYVCMYYLWVASVQDLKCTYVCVGMFINTINNKYLYKWVCMFLYMSVI